MAGISAVHFGNEIYSTHIFDYGNWHVSTTWQVKASIGGIIIKCIEINGVEAVNCTQMANDKSPMAGNFFICWRQTFAIEFVYLLNKPAVFIYNVPVSDKFSLQKQVLHITH